MINPLKYNKNININGMILIGLKNVLIMEKEELNHKFILLIFLHKQMKFFTLLINFFK